MNIVPALEELEICTERVLACKTGKKNAWREKWAQILKLCGVSNTACWLSMEEAKTVLCVFHRKMVSPSEHEEDLNVSLCFCPEGNTV